MKTIKKNPIFSYIDSDFANWNVVDKHPHVEKREINIKTLKKDSTFAEMFTDPENQWVTQAELIDLCTNRKDELSKYGCVNFFLLKSENEFFVASVYLADLVHLKVRVYRFSERLVWRASGQHRFVIPATKPVILNSDTQSLINLDTKIEDAISLLKENGYIITKQF